MVTKTEAVNKLIGKGYNAVLLNNVVIVRFPRGDMDTYQKLAKEIPGILKDIGYDMSWGLQAKKDREIKQEEAEAPV